MTDQYLQEIEKCIQKAALDGVLTTTAIEQYHAILEANEKLVGENKHQNELIVKKNEELSTLKERVNKYVEKEGAFNDREHEVKEREVHMTKLELTATHHYQRVEDHKAMFSQVFRNMEVRRNVFTAVDPGKPDQYGSRISGHTEENNQTEKTE